MDQEAKRVIEKIKHLDIHFIGNSDDKSIKIDIYDVYYIENVERKVFLYTKGGIYSLDCSMTDLINKIENTDLVRISRTCIINTLHLKEIKQIKGSHLEAIMDNDEIVIVPRKYLKDIKNIFKRSSL